MYLLLARAPLIPTSQYRVIKVFVLQLRKSAINVLQRKLMKYNGTACGKTGSNYKLIKYRGRQAVDVCPCS